MTVKRSERRSKSHTKIPFERRGPVGAAMDHSVTDGFDGNRHPAARVCHSVSTIDGTKARRPTVTVAMFVQPTPHDLCRTSGYALGLEDGRRRPPR